MYTAYGQEKIKTTEPAQDSRLSKAVQKVRELTLRASVEIYHSTPIEKAAAIGAIALIGIEWSPLNEYITGANSVEVIESARNNPSLKDSLLSSAETGLVAGTIMAGTQFATGAATARALRSMPATLHSLRRNKENSDSSKGASAVTALGLGASAVIIEENLKDPHRTTKDDVMLAAKASAGIWGANFILGSAVNTSVHVLDAKNLENTSNGLLSVASNPSTYLGLFAAFKVGGAVKRRLKRRLNNQV